MPSGLCRRSSNRRYVPGAWTWGVGGDSLLSVASRVCCRESDQGGNKEHSEIKNRKWVNSVPLLGNDETKCVSTLRCIHAKLTLLRFLRHRISLHGKWLFNIKKTNQPANVMVKLNPLSYQGTTRSRVLGCSLSVDDKKGKCAPWTVVMW